MVSLFVTGLHLREDVGQRVSSQFMLSMAHVDNRKLKNIKKKSRKLFLVTEGTPGNGLAPLSWNQNLICKIIKSVSKIPLFTLKL